MKQLLENLIFFCSSSRNTPHFMEPGAKELSDINICMFLCYKYAISIIFTEQA